MAQQYEAQPLALLLESDIDSREMYAAWLTHSGFRVAEASTVAEALLMAAELRPHVITTDIEDGAEGDGCALCLQLKASELTRHIPVIAVTAWSVGGHVERALRAGCDSVLVKPCSPPDLVAEIHRLLQRAS